jgi:hypothetical protein
MNCRIHRDILYNFLNKRTLIKKIPLPFQNNASRHLSGMWREYRGCFSINSKGVEGGEAVGHAG